MIEVAIATLAGVGMGYIIVQACQTKKCNKVCRSAKDCECLRRLNGEQ